MKVDVLLTGHQRLKIDMHLFETCRQNMKYLLQVLFCFGKNEINIFPRVIIENDNPIFLLFLIEFPKNFVSLQRLYAR